MQQQLCFLVIFIYSSFAAFDIIPYESARTAVVQETPVEIQQFSSSFPFKSKIVRDESDSNQWNGGTILTHEANLKSRKGKSETTIASTRCHNLIFVAFNSAQGFCFNNAENNTNCPGVPDGFYNGVGHYTVSLDGGKTWKYMYSPPPLDSDIYTRSDPWLSMGGKSSKNSPELLYFANLAANRSRGVNPVIGLSVHVARIIYKNNDPREKAIDFEWIRASLIPKIEEIDSMDKEAIAADPFDPNKAYVSYTLFRGSTQWNIELYATKDAGVSWQGPAVLRQTDTELSDRWHQHTYPVVDANANVYVIWYEFFLNDDFKRNLKYKLMKSTDGGITFPDPAITVNPDFVRFNPLTQLPVAHNRGNLLYQPTMDVFTKVYDYRHNYLNRIIVAYMYSLTDSYNGHLGFIDDDSTLLNSINIGISYSDDQGTTWEFIDPFQKPIPTRFVKRLFPTVSVSSDGKSVNVGYLEINEVKRTDLPICNPVGLNKRTSFYHSIADTYYIHSENGGVTWSDPIKLNEESVDWCTTRTNIAPNYGDYILSFSDSKGGIHLAGVTNGFTEVPGFDPPLTTVDVIYYDSNKKCKSSKRWGGIYNAFNNEEHEEEHPLFADFENKDENIEIDIPWTMIVIGVCGITICLSSPFFIWIGMNKKR